MSLTSKCAVSVSSSGNLRVENGDWMSKRRMIWQKLIVPLNAWLMFFNFDIVNDNKTDTTAARENCENRKDCSSFPCLKISSCCRNSAWGCHWVFEDIFIPSHVSTLPFLCLRVLTECKIRHYSGVILSYAYSL